MHLPVLIQCVLLSESLRQADGGMPEGIVILTSFFSYFNYISLQSLLQRDSNAWLDDIDIN